MTVKTTAIEFKTFYNDDDFWPDGRWHEGGEIIITFDGQVIVDSPRYSLLQMPNHAEVSITGGLVQDGVIEFGTFEDYFKKWWEQQGRLTVRAPLDKLEAVKAAIHEAGGKVLE